jgi:hypothetical protein
MSETVTAESSNQQQIYFRLHYDDELLAKPLTARRFPPPWTVEERCYSAVTALTEHLCQNVRYKGRCLSVCG